MKSLLNRLEDYMPKCDMDFMIIRERGFGVMDYVFFELVLNLINNVLFLEAYFRQMLFYIVGRRVSSSNSKYVLWFKIFKPINL